VMLPNTRPLPSSPPEKKGDTYVLSAVPDKIQLYGYRFGGEP